MPVVPQDSLRHSEKQRICRRRRLRQDEAKPSGKAVKQPPENWLILPGRHEGIISEEQFERVQQKLTACPLAQRPKRFETEKSAVRRSALRCLRWQYDEKIRRQGKRPPSMRPLLSSDLFFGSECGGNAASQRSRRHVMLPRMRPVPLPSSDKEKQHCKTYQLDAEFLTRLLQQADPSDRNAFYKSFLHQVDYFRNRDSDKDSFLLHFIFCL